MFENETSGIASTTGTQSMRLVRQRAQASDRDEKRYFRLQGVEHKAATADVELAEQLVGFGDAPLFTSSSPTTLVDASAGYAHVYSVSSPEYDAPRLARRPLPVAASSGLRPGGFISVTTGRARRTRRYW